MPRTDVEVTTPDGVCPVVLITPEGTGPWPAVILYMDAGGVRPAMVEMAEQLAGLGYVAFLPEMYYRNGPYEPFSMASAFADEGERARLMALISGLTKAMAASDAGAFLDFLAAHPDVAGDRVGTTGYCMGGGLSLTTAARHPSRVAAAASFHGGNLASDAADSPHLIAGDIEARVYVAAAVDDRSFPPSRRNGSRPRSPPAASTTSSRPTRHSTGSPFPTVRCSTPTQPPATGGRWPTSTERRSRHPELGRLPPVRSRSCRARIAAIDVASPSRVCPPAARKRRIGSWCAPLAISSASAYDSATTCSDRPRRATGPPRASRRRRPRRRHRRDPLRQGEPAAVQVVRSARPRRANHGPRRFVRRRGRVRSGSPRGRDRARGGAAGGWCRRRRAGCRARPRAGRAPRGRADPEVERGQQFGAATPCRTVEQTDAEVRRTRGCAGTSAPPRSARPPTWGAGGVNPASSSTSPCIRKKSGSALENSTTVGRASSRWSSSAARRPVRAAPRRRAAAADDARRPPPAARTRSTVHEPKRLSMARDRTPPGSVVGVELGADEHLPLAMAADLRSVTDCEIPQPLLTPMTDFDPETAARSRRAGWARSTASSATRPGLIDRWLAFYQPVVQRLDERCRCAPRSCAACGSPPATAACSASAGASVTPTACPWSTTTTSTRCSPVASTTPGSRRSRSAALRFTEQSTASTTPTVDKVLVDETLEHLSRGAVHRARPVHRPVHGDGSAVRDARPPEHVTTRVSLSPTPRAAAGGLGPGAHRPEGERARPGGDGVERFAELGERRSVDRSATRSTVGEVEAVHARGVSPDASRAPSARRARRT